MSKNNTNLDRELFELIKDDEISALKILFKKYYNGLCHFAFTITKNRESSEEVVSDIFMNIWSKRKELNIEISLKSYLFRAVKNQSLNYLKKRYLLTESIDSEEAVEIKNDFNPEDYVFYEELKEQVLSLIDKLPPKRKLIFQMNRFDGLTFEEIAEVLSISIHTVRNQIVKALSFLNEQYPKLKR